MQHIILECGQAGYAVIEVPDRIAQHAHDYQMQFDRWLSSRENEHGYWHPAPPLAADETPPPFCDGLALQYHPPEAFVRWLNTHVLADAEHARILSDETAMLHF